MLPYIKFGCRQASGFVEQAADQTREDLYASGQEPEVGDTVENLPEDFGGTLALKAGEQFEVLEVDGGYLFFADDYGYWPTQFILIQRKEQRDGKEPKEAARVG